MVCARSKDPSQAVISWLDRWGFALSACQLTSTGGHLNSMTYSTLKYAGHMYPVSVEGSLASPWHHSSFFHTIRSPLFKSLLTLIILQLQYHWRKRKNSQTSPTQITSHIIVSLNSTWLTVSSNSKIPVLFIEPLVLLQRFTACSGTTRTRR